MRKNGSPSFPGGNSGCGARLRRSPRINRGHSPRGDGAGGLLAYSLLLCCTDSPFIAENSPERENLAGGNSLERRCETRKNDTPPSRAEIPAVGRI
jgi:hypothetical protein